MKKFLYLILLANFALIFTLWWLGGSGSLWLSSNTGKIIALGRIFGLIAELGIALQLALIGRIPIIEKQFGHDGLNKFHRINGQVLVIFLLAHPILITWGYSRLNHYSLYTQFLLFVNNWEDVLKAVIALFIFLSLIFLSIAIVKKRLRYETWYFLHLLMYIAVLLVLGHQVNFGDFAGQYKWIWYWYVLNFGLLGLLIIYRWLKPLVNFYKHRFFLKDVVYENNNTTSIYIEGKEMQNFRFLPGQFANITFLQSGMWFTHPFSFSQSLNNKNIRLTVKSSGDFTNKIKALKLNTKIIIDGPLGIFTQKSAKLNKFLFLAGGIGITPIRALIEDLAKQGKDIVLLYSNKNSEEIVFKAELEQLKHKYHFIMTQLNLPETNNEYELGRIDEEKIIRLVPDFKEREIYICGPVNMINSLNNLLINLKVPNQQIHFEKFSF